MNYQMKYQRQQPKKLYIESYVPSLPPPGIHSYFFLFLLTTSATIKLAECNPNRNVAITSHKHILYSSEPNSFDTYIQDLLPDQNNKQINSQIDLSSSKPTPPLAESEASSIDGESDPFQDLSSAASDSQDQVTNKRYAISPSKVYNRDELNTFGIPRLYSEPYAPFSDFRSDDIHMQQDSVQFPNSPPDNFNLLDWIEPGSGAGYDNNMFERPEDSSITNELSSSSISPSVAFDNPFRTPLFDQMSRHEITNMPPVLVRRLPRLVGTAGSPWRYKIPSSTFQDEDGDLRYLRSALLMKQFLKSEFTPLKAENNEAPSMNSLQWLQYDQSTQTLYGFPTEEDIGLNVYTLVVGDRWGISSNETIKIFVRPHQSSRAITHSIKFNGIELSSQKKLLLPEVLMDLVKSVTEKVFNERSSQNMVVQSYVLNNISTTDASSQSKSAISITWFNSSLPVHPCDLTGIEQVFRALVEERLLPPDWSLLTHNSLEYSPSQSLMRALSPDYKPSSVGINLLGACESKKTSTGSLTTAGVDTGLKIKTRLGKVRWKLGQPIMYRIPEDVFSADNGLRNTRNLSINLHTIDGKTLDQDPSYDFLEFDQESQTIFGLPFDGIKHVGSRELLLTAKHPLSDFRVRETFIIEIEPQDLTSINNRAFRVSLYFMTRVSIFGPREQVMLGRRMISALEVEDLSHGYEEYADFTVIDIKMFTTGSYIDNSASLSDPANSWKYQDRITLLDGPIRSKTIESLNTHDGSGDGTVIYKLTWTNETIGYRGDCPVEVIRENILYNLERSMSDYIPPDEDLRADDPTKNATVKFYERLRNYFEPAIDLIHLRFEPLSACIEALDLHDVGNNELADIIDRAEDVDLTTEAPLHSILAKPPEVPKVKELSPINSDEYWAIVVLIILVVAIFFVVMMLIMGLNTYRINQEKRFELQMKLAQARQNSMYLSSMMLSDQIQANDLAGVHQNVAKPIYLDERISRKPIILDAEKQLLANGNSSSHTYRPTTVNLTGQTVETTSLEPNMTFTMDSIANMQGAANYGNSHTNTIMANQHTYLDDRQRSMTLNRRANSSARPMSRQGSVNHLSHSQSIITVASMAPQLSIVHSQANVPLVYAPMPVFYEDSAAEAPCDL